jgi:hypothetical protein
MTERFNPQEWRQILLICGSAMLIGIVGILLTRESSRRECVATLNASDEGVYLEDADYQEGPVSPAEQRIEECYQVGLLRRP